MNWAASWDGPFRAGSGKRQRLWHFTRSLMTLIRSLLTLTGDTPIPRACNGSSRSGSPRPAADLLLLAVLGLFWHYTRSLLTLGKRTHIYETRCHVYVYLCVYCVHIDLLLLAVFFSIIYIYIYIRMYIYIYIYTYTYIHTYTYVYMYILLLIAVLGLFWHYNRSLLALQ